MELGTVTEDRSSVNALISAGSTCGKKMCWQWKAEETCCDPNLS